MVDASEDGRLFAARGTISMERYPAIRTIIWPAKGTVVIAIDLTRCSIVY
jgi:hypothetical protein